MKVQILSIFIIALIFTACGNSEQKNVESNEEMVSEIQKEVPIQDSVATDLEQLNIEIKAAELQLDKVLEQLQ